MRRSRRHPGVPEGCPLTANQLEIVRAIAAGHGYKRIAADKHVTVSTVRTTVHHVLIVLGVSTSLQAAVHCWKAGWINVDGFEVTTAPPAVDPPPLSAAEAKIRPAHRLYLHAFDMHLRARSDEEKAATRQIMDWALDPMCRERGINPSGRPKRDLVEMLVAAARRDRRPPRIAA